MQKKYKYLAMSIIVLPLVFFAAIYGLSAYQMNTHYSPINRDFKVAANADIIEGKRLATIHGCTSDCHGKNAIGQAYHGLSAPNLSQIVHRYTDQELEQTIRQGIRPNGTSLYSMPSETYQYLSDEALSNILAYLRTLPISQNTASMRNPSLEWRWTLLTEGHTPAVDLVKDISPPKHTEQTQPDILGEYLARSICAECHAPSFKGYTGFSPSLIMVNAYDAEAFKQLMLTGIGLGQRNLGLMTQTGRQRLSYLRVDEIRALYHYLHSPDLIETLSVPDK
jgi:cytochrome c553